MFCVHCKARKGRYWTNNTQDCCIGSLSKKQDQTKPIKDSYDQYKEQQDKHYSKIKKVVNLLWAKNRKEDMEFSDSNESMQDTWSKNNLDKAVIDKLLNDEMSCEINHKNK